MQIRSGIASVVANWSAIARHHYLPFWLSVEQFHMSNHSLRQPANSPPTHRGDPNNYNPFITKLSHVWYFWCLPSAIRYSRRALGWCIDNRWWLYQSNSRRRHWPSTIINTTHEASNCNLLTIESLGWPWRFITVGRSHFASQTESENVYVSVSTYAAEFATIESVAGNTWDTYFSEGDKINEKESHSFRWSMLSRLLVL